MRREICFRQHDRNDCAAACVASVCAHYGLRLPLIRIRQACGTTADGTTMQGIIDACGRLGLDAVGLRAKEKNPDGLIDVAKPVILHLEKKTGWLHFVVLYGMDGRNATIMDPEDGRMHKTTAEELGEEWSGYVIAVSPSPMFRPGDRSTGIASRLKELLMYHRKEMLAVLAGSMAYTAAALSTPVFLQKIIDSAIPSGDRHGIMMICAAMLLLTVMTWIISYMRSVILVRTSLKIDCRLITGYFRKVFSLPVSFFDSMSSGELNSRVSDAYRIRTFITSRLLLIAISAMTLLTSTAILMTFYWKLALIALCFTPLFAFLYKLSERVNRKLNRRIIEENAKFEQTSIERLSAARSIRYFSSGKEAVRKIEDRYFDTAAAMYKGGIFTAATESTSDAISRLICTVTITAGAFFVLNSELSIGELVSFFSLATVFSTPIVMLIESTREITEARISAERIFEIMDLDDEKGRTEDSLAGYTPCPDDEIEFKNVSFSFPGRRKLIENLSFTIRPGEVALIKGCNGCGKSTLAALLMRGYAPQDGSITSGGIDIGTIPLDIWRRHISIVPQRPDILDGSILENIVMGDTGYDMKSVMAACAMAGLASTIDALPGGILSNTGEHACRLSGGEKQKIAIARALYRKPSVIILDEAYTHLDKDGRDRLAETVKVLKEHRITVVLISHDKESELLADNIIELNKDTCSQA